MPEWIRVLDQRIDELEERLVAVRRRLHARPEPSGEEHETTRYLADLLRECAFTVSVAPSGRGLLAEPVEQPVGGCIGLRADIDALRVRDEKDAPYRSQVEGVAHACGHDAHAAMVFGAVVGLAQIRAHLPWPVAVRAIFQPAEESSEGAKEMVAAGAVEGLRAVIALHVDPERVTGQVGFRTGVLTAYCSEVDIVVRGRGGHAARPHHATDPIAAACHVVASVYQLIPRSVDSRQPMVVTFGSIHGGFTQNVIPEEVHIRGTVRANNHAAISKVEERIAAIARGTAEATGTRIETSFKRGPDAVVNDARVTSVCSTAAAELLGTESIEEIGTPSMGGEDFAEYLAHVPGCLMRLGVAVDGAAAHFLHSPRFDIDENALAIGAKLLAYCAVKLAEPDRGQ